MVTTSLDTFADHSLGEATFSEVVSGENRRRHPRHTLRVEVAVDLGSDHNFYVGFVENVSSGGIFVATQKLAPIGEQLELSIQLPGQAKPITGLGEVRWLRDPAPDSELSPGMGLRFVSLDGDGEEAIEHFVAERAPMFFDDDD